MSKIPAQSMPFKYFIDLNIQTPVKINRSTEHSTHRIISDKNIYTRIEELIDPKASLFLFHLPNQKHRKMAKVKARKQNSFH